MSREPENIESIFYEALKRTDAEERKAYLEATCGVNTQLRADIDSLLQAYENEAGLLKVPADLLEEPIDTLTEGPGTVIGRYKLLEKIGEGGMAVVYMAEQKKPIHRKVALKIIKLGMDTRQVIARFEAERQALAMMDHPNIAKVLDAGATETGRPYFVMELVTGLAITEYCDKKKLTMPERLDLFIQVCNAIQHAHQKSIIHRDIKPSNVMVTLYDGKPVPKVIDFGIAKAINQRLTEKTLFTRYAHMIGTPAYMSPEQAEMSGLDIDTRTDIYSLGVLLYELLTGTTPFDADELREAGYVKIQRIIREEEPAKPSTKLSTMGEALTDIAEHRKSSLYLLMKLVSGDLDWIVMKALEKDRIRRYETVSALAMDVQRHLDHEPVQARPPSAMYRLKKFLRKHRQQVAAGGAMAVLLAGMIVFLAMWNQKRMQVKEAESLRHRSVLSQARESFSRRDFTAALGKVKSILDSTHVGPEAHLLYASILVDGQHPDEAVTKLENLLDERPEIAGAAHSLFARILWESASSDVEKLKKVDEHRQKAEELLPETAEAYFLRAMIAISVKEKLELLNRALELDPGHYESRRLRAFTYYASTKYERMKDDAFAMVVLRPSDTRGYVLHGIALREMGRYEEAVKDFDRAIELTSEQDPQLLEMYNERRRTYVRMGEYGKAVSDAQRCVALRAEEKVYQFYLFCALFASGHYDLAEAKYAEVFKSERTWFWRRCAGYVYETLGQGQEIHLPENAFQNVAFLPIVEAIETYRSLSMKGEKVITEGFHANWSPDGTKLAYSLGVHGHSGIATYDLFSGETELLTVPGRDPIYSPDGQYIAYVRDHEALPVTELAKEHESWATEVEVNVRFEIWIMKADGTDPRPLARGKWPHWSEDSKHLFFTEFPLERILKRISIETEDAEPEEIMSSLNFQPRVSPNGEYVACVENNTLKILDLSSRQLIDQWTFPFGLLWGRGWSPGSDKLVLQDEDSQLAPRIGRGLWIYDLSEKKCEEVLGPPGFLQIGWVSWSPGGNQLALALGRGSLEIWIVQVGSLRDGRTPPERCRDRASQRIRMAEADPENAETYLFHAECFLKLAERWESLTHSVGDVRFVASPPTNLGPTVNSPHNDWFPAISADGLELYFASDRPGGSGGYDLWISQRPSKDSAWTPPISLGPLVNSTDDELGPYLSTDDLTLYFSSSRPGGFGKLDIWMTNRPSRERNWSAPVNLGVPVNSEHYDHAPALSTNRLELLFASSRYGGFDLWVARRPTTNSEWSTPVVLGPTVNTVHGERTPSISIDGLWLFFDSTWRGGHPHTNLDICAAHRETVDSDWQFPVSLGPKVNTWRDEACPRISADGRLLYFSDYPGSTARPGGLGGADLWQVQIHLPDSFELNDDTDLTDRSGKSDTEKEDVSMRKN